VHDGALVNAEGRVSSVSGEAADAALDAGPVWETDGQDWPNKSSSRFVQAAGLRWHVQEMGRGPVLLLLHGTGAATHSWRDLLPILARDFTVIAPDLPGHGFTSLPSSSGLSLPGMATAIGKLLGILGQRPVIGVGHSAGAAVLIRMALDDLIAPKLIVSLNGALQPFGGVAGHLFAPLARLLFLNPFVPRLFSWRAGNAATVERLIRDTGSRIDPHGLALYTRLLRRSGHVRAALGMMANWDLDSLFIDLPRLKAPVLLIAAGNDRAIPAEAAFVLRGRLPASEVRYMRGLGHLAHEEAPEPIAATIVAAARSAGIIRERRKAS
jgi:magnesium chelatase accessory protein